MNDITTQNWNALVEKVGSIGDLQNEFLRVQASIENLAGTLVITNIILGIIAVTLIVLVIGFFRKK